jgi:hypothetical protein
MERMDGMEAMKATVHVGPKGGIEFRLWTSNETFLVVGKYKALPHMDDNQKALMVELEASIKAKKSQKANDDSAWRCIMSGKSW